MDGEEVVNRVHDGTAKIWKLMRFDLARKTVVEPVAGGVFRELMIGIIIYVASKLRKDPRHRRIG